MTEPTHSNPSSNAPTLGAHKRFYELTKARYRIVYFTVLMFLCAYGLPKALFAFHLTWQHGNWFIHASSSLIALWTVWSCFYRFEKAKDAFNEENLRATITRMFYASVLWQLPITLFATGTETLWRAIPAYM